METICIKCQILFSGKIRKNISFFSSAELAQRELNVNALFEEGNFLVAVCRRKLFFLFCCGTLGKLCCDNS